LPNVSRHLCQLALSLLYQVVHTGTQVLGQCQHISHRSLWQVITSILLRLQRVKHAHTICQFSHALPWDVSQTVLNICAAISLTPWLKGCSGYFRLKSPALPNSIISSETGNIPATGAL
jgi:hypothetical protein